MSWRPGIRARWPRRWRASRVVAATRDHRRIGRDIPFAEIRAISNLIGRRDRSTWNIPLAFDALADAMSTLLKEPLP